MGIWRVYSGNDGESHLEELALGQHPELAALQKAKGLRFRRPGTGGSEVSNPDGFHNAPDRRWAIILTGQLEVELGDGSKHHFGAGDAMLFEDLTGRGHISRWTDVILAGVPLAD